MRYLRLFAPILLAAALACAQPLQTIASKTAGMKKLDGFFPLYWDATAGKLWLEIDRFDSEFLYLESLPAGLGSNDIGLDRGQRGASRVVRFERSGPRVLMVEPNYKFRAISNDPAVRRGVEESFAQSVLWGFDVQAEDGGRVLVDATQFWVRDAHDVTGTLRRTKQGDYRLDASRCALYLPRTRNFPKNTEVEATLTLTLSGGEPGRWVGEVTPSAEAVTVREHQSFVELPGPGYEPRVFDPRAGYFGIGFREYGAPLGDPLIKHFISRHRLKKKDPNAAIGEPVTPIVYYVDRSAPEPIRSALIEGASWWNQAFEAAGYKNAFRVELLPEDADPMDIRYNIIQWVHRYSRGWSYGGGITDPRTGEIIKGAATLGSLRARQDYMIAEGLLAPYEEGQPIPDDMREMALARIRQLAAHEVGHTLGLQHNFAASVNDRASVMDYPPPVAVLDGPGAPDLSKAYATGIGAWDKIVIAYGYQDFPKSTDAAAALHGIIDKALRGGLLYQTDGDARPQGSASPVAHLWDNGRNAVDELERMIGVRARVLSRFSEKTIRVGAPMATLEDVLVPAYLMHRYQTEAASKVLGGLKYTYALRGDGQIATHLVPSDDQRRALDVLLETIAPGFLRLPPGLAAMIPPRPPGYPRTREDFPNHTGVTFDPLGPAEAAANITVTQILNAERAARLIEQHAAEANVDGFGRVIDRLLEITWKSSPLSGTGDAEIQRVVDAVVLHKLMGLSASAAASNQVRAIAFEKLSSLKSFIDRQQPVGDEDHQAEFLFASNEIKRFLDNPSESAVPKDPEPPPGQPIGEDTSWD